MSASHRARKKADVILVGGGSGGHLTPLLPVAEELHKLDPNLRIAHIGKKNDKLNSIVNVADISQHYEISAGKLRRYHGDSKLRRVFNFKDNLLNTRDILRIIAGIFQSWRLLGQLKPKAIMMKGGYVCAPVGIAARFRGIPYITHDSDAMVSLAHRIIAKHAAKHATAMAPALYGAYKQDKIVQVGVPIKPDFVFVSESMRAAAKKELKLPENSIVLLVTGGGLGSQTVNEAVASSAQELLRDPDVIIIHLTGHKNFDEVQAKYSTLEEDKKPRILVEAFTSIMHTYSAAADVVIARAGATNMAEFAAQAKACIVIPSPFLSGGHQLKNAKALEDEGVAVIVQEDSLDELSKVIVSLLSDNKRREELGQKLHKSFIPDAAKKLATMLVEITSQQRAE